MHSNFENDVYECPMTRNITVGVLALQGAFVEHIRLLKNASVDLLKCDQIVLWEFIEVRTPSELAICDALIIPGGESTTVSLVAERSNLLEPLREFVKYVKHDAGGSVTKAGIRLMTFVPTLSEPLESQYGVLVPD